MGHSNELEKLSGKAAGFYRGVHLCDKAKLKSKGQKANTGIAQINTMTINELPYKNQMNTSYTHAATHGGTHGLVHRDIFSIALFNKTFDGTAPLDCVGHIDYTGCIRVLHSLIRDQSGEQQR